MSEQQHGRPADFRAGAAVVKLCGCYQVMPFMRARLVTEYAAARATCGRCGQVWQARGGQCYVRASAEPGDSLPMAELERGNR